MINSLAPSQMAPGGIRVSVPIERSSMGIKSVGFACHLKGAEPPAGPKECEHCKKLKIE